MYALFIYDLTNRRSLRLDEWLRGGNFNLLADRPDHEGGATHHTWKTPKVKNTTL